MTVRRTIIVVNVIAVNRTPPLEVRKSNPEVGLSDFEGGGFRLLLGLTVSSRRIPRGKDLKGIK